MELTRHELREIIRLLKQARSNTVSGRNFRSLSGGPVPAPEIAPIRCGCWTPLIWDSHIGRWLHLDDLTACVPGRPRR